MRNNSLLWQLWLCFHIHVRKRAFVFERFWLVTKFTVALEIEVSLLQRVFETCCMIFFCHFVEVSTKIQVIPRLNSNVQSSMKCRGKVVQRVSRRRFQSSKLYFQSQGREKSILKMFEILQFSRACFFKWNELRIIKVL